VINLIDLRRLADQHAVVCCAAFLHELQNRRRELLNYRLQDHLQRTTLMRVRCSKVETVLAEGTRSSAWLTKGKEYIVLSIEAPAGRAPLLRILDDSGGPSLWSAHLFDLLSGHVPANWQVNITQNGSLEFAPPSACARTSGTNSTSTMPTRLRLLSASGTPSCDKSRMVRLSAGPSQPTATNAAPAGPAAKIRA